MGVGDFAMNIVVSHEPGMPAEVLAKAVAGLHDICGFFLASETLTVTVNAVPEDGQLQIALPLLAQFKPIRPKSWRYECFKTAVMHQVGCRLGLPECKNHLCVMRPQATMLQLAVHTQERLKHPGGRLCGVCNAKLIELPGAKRCV
jgi:hypothetical protein